MSHHKHLVHFLQEAYALEEKLITSLEKQAADLKEDFPEVSQQLLKHQKETKGHSEMVSKCLEQLGESPSDMKAMGGKAAATMEGMMIGMKEDKVIHYSAMGFAVEHFEIAHYTAVMVTAEELGKTEIVDMCQQILAEEQAMADWIEDHAEETVKKYLKLAHREE